MQRGDWLMRGRQGHGSVEIGMSRVLDSLSPASDEVLGLRDFCSPR